MGPEKFYWELDPIEFQTITHFPGFGGLETDKGPVD